MPAPTFGRDAPSLWDNSKPPFKALTASFHLEQLDQFIVAPRGHAHGSWGYAVLRTVYTPESDALFPVALARLTSYVQWWCRYLRFGEESGVRFADTNEEVSRRLYFDVVEDRDGLA
jgi:hypothetical protein